MIVRRVRMSYVGDHMGPSLDKVLCQDGSVRTVRTYEHPSTYVHTTYTTRTYKHTHAYVRVKIARTRCQTRRTLWTYDDTTPAIHARSSRTTHELCSYETKSAEKNTPYAGRFNARSVRIARNPCVVHEKNTPYGAIHPKKIPPMGVVLLDIER